MLRMVSYLESLLSLKRQNLLSASQILSTYINTRLRYNYFRFRKANVGHIGIPLSYSISTLSPLSAFRDALSQTYVCAHYGLPNFNQNGPYSYYFMSIFKMAVATSTSDFGLSDVAVFTKFKVYRQTKFRWNNSIHG